MTTQAFALRRVRLTDLPALKRWREVPDVQRHLRHPHTPWAAHLRWWWGIRAHRHPTRRVWAVTYAGALVGQAGLYYRMGAAAEVSLLVMVGARESFAAEQEVLRLLERKARAWACTTLWAEVLATAPLARHSVFPPFPQATVSTDLYSTIYRWSLA